MTDCEYHPHVINISPNGDDDHYTAYNRYTGTEFVIGCLVCAMFMSLVIGIAAFFIGREGLYGNDKGYGNVCTWRNGACMDARAAEREEAERWKAEIRKRFVQDSAARYSPLYDSLLSEFAYADSVSAVLPVAGKISVEYLAFIDDGVTSRQVAANILVDTLVPDAVTGLGESFGEMAYTAAVDRQAEIDADGEYYTRRIRNEE